MLYYHCYCYIIVIIAVIIVIITIEIICSKRRSAHAGKKLVV